MFTVLWLRSPECGVGTFAMAIDLPSGDQAIGDDGGPGGKLTGRLHVPDVSRRAAPLSFATSQTCVEVGAFVTRKSVLEAARRWPKRSLQCPTMTTI